MNDNAMQSEFWNGPVGELWAGRQDVVDNTLRKIGEALTEFAAPAPGMRILDIGCGAGTSTLALAAAAAPGTALGLDVSAPMIAAAKARGVPPNTAFILADAANHRFEQEFDLAYSRFGVMFFTDPAAAFANIRKALKPGGRLAFVCWRAYEENQWARDVFEAALDLLPPQEPTDPLAPGPFALADRRRLKTILARAGFQDVRVSALDTVMMLGATAQDAAYEVLQLGPLSRAARELDDEVRAQIRDRVRPVLESFKTRAGITPAAACWLVGAVG